jgi:hypothetical protein
MEKPSAGLRWGLTKEQVGNDHGGGPALDFHQNHLWLSFRLAGQETRFTFS